MKKTSTEHVSQESAASDQCKALIQSYRITVDHLAYDIVKNVINNNKKDKNERRIQGTTIGDTTRS